MYPFPALLVPLRTWTKDLLKSAPAERSDALVALFPEAGTTHIPLPLLRWVVNPHADTRRWNLQEIT